MGTADAGTVRERARALARPLAACLAAVLVATGLGGCAYGFVYDRLDWAVAWYVDGLVSLEEAQDRQLHALVHSTLDWHRRTQLPRYIELLDSMATEAAGPVDVADVARRYAQVEVFLDELLRQVTPGAASLLATLTPAQREELRQNLDEDNAELREEYSGDTPEERRERRAHAAIKSLQRFYGRLGPSQRALVEARLAAMADVSEQWLERREHWQERFLDVLAAPPPGGLEAALLRLALEPNQFDTPEYRRLVEANRRATFAMIAELSLTLTPEQRRHMQRKLQEYAADLRGIAAGGPDGGSS